MHAPRRSILPLLLVAVAVLAVAAGWILRDARAARFDASMDVFFAADQRSQGSFEKIGRVMRDDVACLVLLRFDGIFSDEGARLIDELGADLARLDGVVSVFSLTRASRPVRSPGLHLDLRDLVRFEPFLPLTHRSDDEWRHVREIVTGYPWARDLLVSRDGKWTMLVAQVDRDLSTDEARVGLRDDVEGVVAPFRDRVEEAHVGGFPLIEAEVRDAIQADAHRFLVLLPILLVAILFVAFRSVQVILCVLAFEALGVGLLPVVFRWNGASINIYTGILFPLVAGLQLTFLTHLFAALHWAQAKGYAFGVALRVALRHVTRPSIIAAATTVIGLLSLMACDVGLVREFGWLGSQAVVLCFAVTFAPPWLLALVATRGHRVPRVAALHAADDVDLWMGRLGPVVDALHRRRWLVLGAVLLLVLASLPAIPFVRTDLRAIEFLSTSSPSRQTFAAVDRHMGGMNLFELEVDTGHEGGIEDPDVLHFLEREARYAEGLDGVTTVYGYAQIFEVIHQLWRRDAPGSLSVPDDPGEIRAIAMVVGGQEFLFQDSLYDVDHQRTTLFVRTRDMPAVRYLALLEEIVDHAEADAPPGVTIGSKAGLHSVLESDRRIVASQVRSLLLCIGAVFLTLLALWRSARLALVAVLVNVPPLAAVLAMLGYGGVPLNSVTVMVSAVVLGIAVDDGIHLLTFWSEERARFEDPVACLRWVLAHKLKPMTCTTAILIGGLGLFLWSRFPPVADFGELAILALAVALASVVLVAPTLLLAVFGARRRAVATPEEDGAPDPVVGAGRA